MATTASKPSAVKSKPPKEKKEKQPQPSGSERLKTVVRRLPPNLPEDVFWQSVQTWVTDDTVSWKVFYAGKLRKRYVWIFGARVKVYMSNRLNKENIPSRAYIAFKNEEHLTSFGRGYDGHVFRDKAGLPI
jgi:regulator of nonsense transcripts 3